ncbi:UvrD-helicase domain-containing protein [Mycoplasmatota bacterium]|nr:UvrD-helicase domain-containing protein [Mycoplasmatota bacterium]
MDLNKNQMEVLKAPLGFNLLIEGYSGVGKTTVLLKKYESLLKKHKVSQNDTIFIVNDELKKQILLNQYFLLSSKYNMLNVYTMNELIYKYLKRIDLPLFQNTINNDDKKLLIDELVKNYQLGNDNFDFTVDFVLDEINYIQSNICFKSNKELDETLKQELKHYLLIPRRSIKKGLLSFREKQGIWQIYNDYLSSALSGDFFDKQTFYQSFLRLIYHQHENNELAMTFTHVFLDDIQDFSKIELDIIYYLYQQKDEEYSCYMTLDELKSKDRYKNFKSSLLFKSIQQSVILDINYRNSKNVFSIIETNLTNNELINPKLTYRSKSNRNDFKSVLTYYYNKRADEKREVFFDRLDLLISNMNYSLKDILVMFTDMDNLEYMRNQCKMNNIKVHDIYDHVGMREVDAITFVHKKDITNCEFKVVIIYDADNKKLCTGPINKIININKNFEDAINFYIALANATDFLIINSSISEPSHLLLPSLIDYNKFVFDIGSKFEIKSTLNVYRISDFIAFIKDNLCKYYGYKLEDLKTHPIFDILIDVDYHKIGVKILDNNIDNDVISYILKNGQDLTNIVIFDSHHYLTFKNVNNEFIRVVDIPSK